MQLRSLAQPRQFVIASSVAMLRSRSRKRRVLPRRDCHAALAMTVLARYRLTLDSSEALLDGAGRCDLLHQVVIPLAFGDEDSLGVEGKRFDEVVGQVNVGPRLANGVDGRSC